MARSPRNSAGVLEESRAASRILQLLRSREVEQLCRQYHVSELAVFGSLTSPEFGKRSDVDLLVKFFPSAGIGFLAFSRLQRELTSLLGRRVDLVPKDGLKALIRDDVLASARVIYAP